MSGQNFKLRVIIPRGETSKLDFLYYNAVRILVSKCT